MEASGRSASKCIEKKSANGQFLPNPFPPRDLLRTPAASHFFFFFFFFFFFSFFFFFFELLLDEEDELEDGEIEDVLGEGLGAG